MLVFRLAFMFTVALLAFVSTGGKSDAQRTPTLVITGTPHVQPFQAGTSQPFDIMITNVGPAQYSANLDGVDPIVTTGNPGTGDAFCDSAPEKYTNLSFKGQVAINLMPGQSVSISGITDMECAYPDIQAGIYSLHLEVYVEPLPTTFPNRTIVPVDSNTFTIAVNVATPVQLSSTTTPPPLPSAGSSVLQQQLNVPTRYFNYANSLGQEDLQGGLGGATLAKGSRLILPTDSGGFNEYLELGDVSGAFGTGAMSDTWFGHYATWENNAGDVTTLVCGDMYPTGQHNFIIGQYEGGWNLAVDGESVLQVDDVNSSVSSIAMESFLTNSSLSSGSFTSGTEVIYEYYLDSNGNFQNWTQSADNDSNYPGSRSTFDTGTYGTIFTNAAILSVAAAETRSLRKPMERFRPRSIPNAKEIRGGNESSQHKFLLTRNPFSQLKAHFDTSKGNAISVRLEKFGEVAINFLAPQTSRNRLIWDVKIRVSQPIQTLKETFPIGTYVDDYIDAYSGQLLGFTIKHSLISR